MILAQNLRKCFAHSGLLSLIIIKYQLVSVAVALGLIFSVVRNANDVPMRFTAWGVYGYFIIDCFA